MSTSPFTLQFSLKLHLIRESETQEGESPAWIQEEKIQETQSALTQLRTQDAQEEPERSSCDQSKKNYFSWLIFWSLTCLRWLKGKQKPVNLEGWSRRSWRTILTWPQGHQTGIYQQEGIRDQTSRFRQQDPVISCLSFHIWIDQPLFTPSVSYTLISPCHENDGECSLCCCCCLVCRKTHTLWSYDYGSKHMTQQ